MKKIILLVLLITTGCKTTKTPCDAYSEVEYDIHKIQLESQKKYSTVCTLK